MMIEMKISASAITGLDDFEDVVVAVVDGADCAVAFSRSICSRTL